MRKCQKYNIVRQIGKTNEKMPQKRENENEKMPRIQKGRTN